MVVVVAAIGIIMTIVDHMVEMAVVTAATVNIHSQLLKVNSVIVLPMSRFSFLPEIMIYLLEYRWRPAG